MKKDAINAGIIPALTSALTQKLYLEDLNENPVTWQTAQLSETDLDSLASLFIQAVMCFFEMIFRILHVIAQTEKFKGHLEQHRCCDVSAIEIDDLQEAFACSRI